jgi:hypothetical protein
MLRHSVIGSQYLNDSNTTVLQSNNSLLQHEETIEKFLGPLQAMENNFS